MDWLVICWLAVFQGTSTAPGVPYSARIVLPEAEVRAGPSIDSKLYITNRLRQGDTVVVEQERPDGWLAVRPPEGSFSWVNGKNLQKISPNQPTYLVQVNEGSHAPVYMGSSQLNAKPTAESIKLNRGTQVRAIGPAQVDGNDTWVPIAPPSGEVRYLRFEAIGKKVEVNTIPVASNTPLTTGVNPLSSPPAVSGLPPAIANNGNCDALSRWNQAVQAEQAGNLQEAIQLYGKVGQDFSCSQPAMATQAYTRANWLAECIRQGVKNTVQICPPSQPRITPKTIPVSNTGGGPPTVFASQNSSTQGPATMRGPCLPGTPAPAFLRKSGRSVDNGPAYYLESQQGRPLIYVLPAPGQNLDFYLNQRVEVNGPSSYRGDLRAYVITALQIQPR